MRSYKTVIIILSAIVFAACQATGGAMTPTETMKALNEASRTKDAETIKKLVSKGTLDMLEISAKRQNTTVDELLKQDKGAPFKELPEMRNEKITGDTATVEVKNNSARGWETLPFVKEDGIWKVAIDKFMEDVMQKARDAMNQPPAAAAPPPASSATNK